MASEPNVISCCHYIIITSQRWVEATLKICWRRKDKNSGVSPLSEKLLSIKGSKDTPVFENAKCQDQPEKFFNTHLSSRATGGSKATFKVQGSFRELCQL